MATGPELWTMHSFHRARKYKEAGASKQEEQERDESFLGIFTGSLTNELLRISWVCSGPTPLGNYLFPRQAPSLCHPNFIFLLPVVCRDCACDSQESVKLQLPGEAAQMTILMSGFLFAFFLFNH